MRSAARPWRPAIAAMTVAALLSAGAAAAPVAWAGPAPPAIRGADSASAIPGSYIVRLKDTASVRADGLAGRARTLVDGHRGKLGQVWERALHGFAATMSEHDARALAAEPDVEYVEQDQRRAANRPQAVRTAGPVVAPMGFQTPVSWGLDRIDQHALPLDNHYSYDDTAGAGVHVYLLDTGIRITHVDFGGRASYGPNLIPDGRGNSDDCVGVGTTSAGIVGGTQYGVAKKASLVAVRVFGCDDVATTTSVLAGIDWVIDNAIRPAVMNIAVADFCITPDGQVICDPRVAGSLVEAEEIAVAAGLTVVAPAGDSNRDSCARSSGSAPNVIYVGATTISDTKAAFSNHGPCVRTWAPGDSITSDWHTSNTATNVASSTDLASAHVTGAVALLLGLPQFAQATPDQIADELQNDRATRDVIVGLDAASPNQLLFTGPPGIYVIGTPTAMARAGDGRLHLFGVDTAGFLYQRQQTAPGSTTWSPWVQSATRGWLSVGAGSNFDGRIELTGLTATGEIWQRSQSARNSNTWFNWVQLDRPGNSAAPVGRAVSAHNLSNRMEIFATNHLGQLFYRSQSSAGLTTWGPWTGLSFAGKMRSIASVANADGRIEIIGIDDAGQVWRAAQASPNDNNWSPFTKLSGFAMASIAAARNDDGTLELIGVDTGGGVWRRQQTSVGSAAWSNWVALPRKTMADVAMGTDIDGRVLLIGVDNVGHIWQSVQISASSDTYQAWSLLDGTLRP